ncbi:MAG TPA: HNH endonuclease domain-containing protein [Abditibacteriaceae bacterium]|jgi:hypothetical protein
MNTPLGNQTLAAILRHDSKVTTYKIALLRAINDVVLAFPDSGRESAETLSDVAIPLHLLAERWVAYYWPFMDVQQPIYQGPRAVRDGVTRNDLDFRPMLTRLRQAWEQFQGVPSLPADGFLLLTDLRTPRRKEIYPAELRDTFDATVRIISKTIQMPIRYAGAGNWTIFDKPSLWRDLMGRAGISAVPGTERGSPCLVINKKLWEAFQELSLWVEALCIHEWCLFTESAQQSTVHEDKGQLQVDRGYIYCLLTARPDNRRPLTWERNQIEILMIEGVNFTCPWTQKVLRNADQYDLDHLLPLAIYPINELWNLLPVDRRFNQHVKRHRIPSWERLQSAEPYMAQGYANYEKSLPLREAMHQDTRLRFTRIGMTGNFSATLAGKTIHFIEEVARARSVVRF